MAKADPGAVQQGQPQPGKKSGSHAESGASPAQSATPGGSGPATPAGADTDRQTARMWGQPTDRQRNAVIQSGDEKVLGKYQRLVDDYYRTMSVKAKAAGE